MMAKRSKHKSTGAPPSDTPSPTADQTPVAASPVRGSTAPSPAATVAVAKANLAADLDQGRADVANAMAAADAAVRAGAHQTALAIHHYVTASLPPEVITPLPPTMLIVDPTDQADHAIAAAMQASSKAIEAAESLLETDLTAANRAMTTAMHAADESVTASEQAASAAMAAAAPRRSDAADS